MSAVDEVVQCFSGGVTMAWRRFSMKPETERRPSESKCHDIEIFLLRHLHRRYPAVSCVTFYLIIISLPLYQTSDDNYGRARLRIL